MNPKITCTKFSDHYQVRFFSEDSTQSVRTFDTKREVDAYMNGVNDVRYMANSLIQSLPKTMIEEKGKS